MVTPGSPTGSNLALNRARNMRRIGGLCVAFSVIGFALSFGPAARAGDPENQNSSPSMMEQPPPAGDSVQTPHALDASSPLVADLSIDNIAIATNFTGEKLLMFGAIDGTGQSAPDIIITIRGPTVDATIRKKDKTLGIWTNATKTEIGPVPAFYAVLSNRPVRDIAGAPLLSDYELGIHNLRFAQINGTLDSAELDQFVGAYKRLKQDEGLYIAQEKAVTIVANRLFRSEISVPSNVPLGKYHIEFHLFENGHLIARQSGALEVDYEGLENTLHTMAFQMPLLYGVVAVLLAFLMGWGIGVIFRQR